MSSDTLVYEMANSSEGSANIFVRKDWVNINDNMSQNYSGNQCVIDTSQLSNSNKYASYREGYLVMPLLLTATNNIVNEGLMENPDAPGTSCDYAFGLKNWFGTIIHNFTLEYNGTTIIQQTPLIPIYNNFRLVSSMDVNTILTLGQSIGFYPDSSLSIGFNEESKKSGTGTFNNVNKGDFTVVSAAFNNYSRFNNGFLKRQQMINFDPQAKCGEGDGDSYEDNLLSANNCNQLYKSYIFNKKASDATHSACWQCAITAKIMLKHICTFFNNIPLMKGVFLKLTLGLNQCTVTLTQGAAGILSATVVSPLGGVSPLMIASAADGNGSAAAFRDGADLALTLSIAVGGKRLNPTQIGGPKQTSDSPMGQSVMLYVPMYTFASAFETAYLASPVKKICYTDVYMYQIKGITAGNNINQLLTNGIANLKSCIVCPFFDPSDDPTTIEPFFSPFDTAGGGTLSPYALINNFNVVVSGQNAIYNQVRYGYEQFMNQTYPINKVNGGLTDGLTSGCFGETEWEAGYNYYAVDISRCLTVEEAVPKSITIVGTNQCVRKCNYVCFLEYGVEISIDILSGSRVG